MKARYLLVASIASGFLLSGLSSAVDAPNVKRLGKTIGQYKDDVIQVAVSWRYAQINPKERWTFFETWMMPAGNNGLDINREDIALYLPDGTRIPLPSQKTLTEGLPDIRRVETIGDVTREPMEGYFTSRNGLLRLGFHEIPGTAITFDSRGIPSRWATYGDLFFPNPTGKWEKGIYTFTVKNKQVDVKIPMPIGIEGELERVK
ncbi:MAG: hypothetical protein ACHQPI_09770 [Thermoanaerobaculia bacterium]